MPDTAPRPNALVSRLLKIIVPLTGLAVVILKYLAENREWLQSLSLSIIAGLRGVQVPANFVHCAFYSAESLNTPGLIFNTGTHDALFGRLCEFNIGWFKLVPALVYALVKGFAAGFWGLLFSSAVLLICLVALQNYRRGKIDLGALFWYIALSVLIMWLLSVVIIWIFEAISALLGVLATFSATIVGTAILSTLGLRREMGENISKLKAATKSTEHDGGA